MRKIYSSLHQWAQDADAALRSLVEKNNTEKMENNTAIAIEAKVTKHILDTIETEYYHAKIRHSQPFKNAHEGYAVLLEEVDELWDEIKHGQDKELMCVEAIQIAAMALRFIRELTIFEASLSMQGASDGTWRSKFDAIMEKLFLAKGMSAADKAYHQNLKENPNR